jgi:hypothetical protein
VWITDDYMRETEIKKEHTEKQKQSKTKGVVIDYDYL